jgi:hypothetical protein
LFAEAPHLDCEAALVEGSDDLVEARIGNVMTGRKDTDIDCRDIHCARGPRE